MTLMVTFFCHAVSLVHDVGCEVDPRQKYVSESMNVGLDNYQTEQKELRKQC